MWQIKNNLMLEINIVNDSIKYEDEKNKSKGYNVVNGNKELEVGSLEILKGGRGKTIKKAWVETCTNETNPLRWSSFVRTGLEGTIPCLEFTIEIQSNSLMYNPNKEIRDRVFPVKIGKFSVKYYTFG